MPPTVTGSRRNATLRSYGLLVLTARAYGDLLKEMPMMRHTPIWWVLSFRTMALLAKRPTIANLGYVYRHLERPREIYATPRPPVTP